MPSPSPSPVAHRPLRRFGHLAEGDAAALFERPPGPVRAARTAEEVGAALGAVLYAPATTPTLGRRLVDGHWGSLTAVVACLEDAIADDQLEAGEAEVVRLLQVVREAVAERDGRWSLPFTFVRVRSPEHLARLLDDLGPLADELDGVVLPKFEPATARAYLKEVAARQHGRDRPLWAMPILEGPDVAHLETRRRALLEVREAVADHAGIVPCVRLGGTDLSGMWGLRRSRDHSIYDLAVVRDVIADVVNVLGRDGGAPAISGAVWEWYADDRVFVPRLRESPFRRAFGEEHGPAVRRQLLSQALDGLLHETLLDRVNGLHGKTAIHPAHLLPIDAAHVVTHEEWLDAQSVLAGAAAGHGVRSRPGGTRMNEPKPHLLWAQRLERRAAAFGVLAAEKSFLALLQD